MRLFVFNVKLAEVMLEARVSKIPWPIVIKMLQMLNCYRQMLNLYLWSGLLSLLSADHLDHLISWWLKGPMSCYLLLFMNNFIWTVSNVMPAKTTKETIMASSLWWICWYHLHNSTEDYFVYRGKHPPFKTTGTLIATPQFCRCKKHIFTVAAWNVIVWKWKESK